MKPMLASTIEDFAKLIFPIYASAKLDGYRCLCVENRAVSRNLKPIRNKYVREQLEANMDVLNGLDGELCMSNLVAPFSEVSSAMGAYEGQPDFVYVIFDCHTEPDSDYFKRFMSKGAGVRLPDFVKVVPSRVVDNVEELMEAHLYWTSQGFEGTMVRRADGLDRYKHGRSSPRELFLGKIKDFSDAEATILGFVERRHNGNEATTDNLGHTKRSSHQENMVGRGDLGALIVKSKDFEKEFQIGSGFDDFTRKLIWDSREDYLGKLVKFKFQPHGVKDVPRFPTYLGIRDENDLS